MVILKDIIGYEGLYMIDNLGNVISLPKFQGNRFHNKYKVLKPKLNKAGYYEVSLSKNGVLKSFLLHRLIAIHFLDNKDNLPQVNHKNGVKTDNRLDNLEWVTISENTKHAFDNNLGNFKENALNVLQKINSKTSYKKVIFYKDDKEFVFNSIKEAAETLSLNKDNITRAIRKKQKVSGYIVVGEK